MVGQRILANYYVRTAWTGRPYSVVDGRRWIVVRKGLIDGEACPREGRRSVRAKALPQFVKVHWRGLRD